MSVVNAIHEGVFSANRKYERWTQGEYWIGDAGVEGFLVAEICDAIHGIQVLGQSLRMEVSFSEISKCCGIEECIELPEGMTGGQRADIVLFNTRYKDGSDNAICIIEVKRLWNDDGCWNDMVRMRKLITTFGSRRKGSLNRGFLSVYFGGHTKEVERTITKVERNVKEWLKSEEYGKDMEGVKVTFHKKLSPISMFSKPSSFDTLEYQFGSFVIGLSSTEIR